MPIDRSQEKISSRVNYGEVVVKKPEGWKQKALGAEAETETFKGFIATHRLVATEGDPNEVSELYLSFREGGDKHSLNRLIDIKIQSIRKKAEKRIALTDAEVEEVRRMIDWCPGGTEATQFISEVRQVAEAQIFGKDVKKAREAEVLKASEDWDKLRNRDLNLGDANAKKAAEQVEKDNEFIADLYLIFQAHGIEAQSLSLSDIVRESLIREGRQDLLQKMRTGESGRGGRRLSESAANQLLSRNPVEYWNNRLLDAVEARLKGMRSSAVARLDADGQRQKMKIGRPADKKHFKKGFSPALVFQTVSDDTEIGSFLDDMGRGAYWRGKASLDVLYWSFYKGALMSNNESRFEAKDTDIFAERNVISHTLRGYGGAVPLSYMEKDPKFVDAIKILYGLYKDKTYEERLQILAQEYNFNINGDLPDFVTDAVMFEKVYVLDALNMSRADLRILSYHPAQMFDNELATDAQGKVLQFLGQNMRFTESPMIKMGWYDVSNDKFNYEAMVPDFREYDPDKYWDQKDKTWQHIFMYLLELNDRRHDLTRKYMSEAEEIQIDGEAMTATPGQTGEYLNYQNERRKRKKGEKEWSYDHRRAVFERIQAIWTDDLASTAGGGEGKAGWNEPLNAELFGNDVTVRDAVSAFINFMGEDFSGSRAININGVEIDKRANEIFYNDELAALLNEFEADPNNPAYAPHRGRLTGFLFMREVLRDHRCWGFVFDLNDNEVQERVFNNMDITFVENYDIAANAAKALLSKLTRASAVDDVYALKVTPAEIEEAATEFGHRRHNTQNNWPLVRFLAFIEAAMLRRLTEMEIASMQDLMQYIDPMGKVKLGVSQEIQAVLGLRKETYLAHRSLLGKMEEKGYMQKMKDLRLVLAEKGLIRNWTNAMRSYVEKLRAAEALQWAQQRDIPLQQMAGMYEELADGYDVSGLQPVESWQVVDVVIKGEEIKRHNLLIQSLNRTQIDNFFDEMTDDESGEAFGGARKIKLNFSPYPNTAIREKPDTNSHEVKAVEIDKSGVKSYLMVQRHRSNGAEWFKISNEDGDHIGWVNANEVDYEYDADINGPEMRPGEVTFLGGRYFWEKIGGRWQWQWRTGAWKQHKAGPMNYELGFFEEEGFVRELKMGTEASVAEYEKATGKKVDKNTLQETEVIRGSGQEGIIRAKPAKYRNYKFKSEKHREYFYNMRQATLLSMLLGRPVEGAQAVSRSAGEARASGAALYPEMYVNEVGDFMQLLQFGYWITTQMRSVELYAACRGALLAKLKGWFGMETAASEVIEQRQAIYQKLMQGALWGTDQQAGERFVSEISELAFIRHGKDSFTKRFLDGANRKAEDWGRRFKAQLLKVGIQATSFKVFDGKVNGFGFLTGGSAAAFLLPLTFPPLLGGASLGVGWALFGTGISFVAGSLAGNGVGGLLAKKIDVDISDANLNRFAYLRSHYDDFVPLE